MVEPSQSDRTASPRDRLRDEETQVRADGGSPPPRSDASPPRVSAPVAPEEQPEDDESLVTRLRRALLYASVGGVALSLVAAGLRRLLARFESEGEPSETDPSPGRREAMPRVEGSGTDDGEDEDGTDVGPLLGLALLALIAALVRRFGREATEDARDR